jgi:hypothetical protein
LILPRGANDHVFTHTMTLYDGHTAIPEIRDGGPGKVSATDFAAIGKREALGHGDQRAAREAIEAPHAGGPELPSRADSLIGIRLGSCSLRDRWQFHPSVRAR